MKKYIIILIALIPLFFMSCNPDGIGIFYKISVEPHLSSSALSEKSVYKIVELSGTKYVLAGGTVYKENGSDWDALKAPSGEIQAVSLASTSTTIYSVYADNSNSTMYQLSGTSWAQAAGTSGIADSNDLTLITIDGLNTALFVNIETSTVGVYNISSYDGGTLTDITGGNSISMPVVSAAYDGTTDYYIVSSNTTNATSAVIYTTNALSTNITVTTPTNGIDEGIGAIIYYSSNLYTSAKDGKLYKSIENPSSLNWGAVNASALSNKRLGNMEIIDIGGTNYLLIASNGGFYEMNLSGGTPVSPTIATIGSTVYKSVDLYTEIVFSIFSSAANKFYIGSSNGLWYSDTNELTIK